MLEALYGSDYAKKVEKRIFEVDTFFGKWVLENTYGQAWANPILTIKEKSIVAIVSLAALSDGERLGIHFRGFLHLKGTVNDIQRILIYMLDHSWITTEIISHAEQLKKFFADSVVNPKFPLSEDEMRAAMRLQMTYCGCPPVMEAMGVLTDCINCTS